MYIQYAGFDVKDNSRVYNFDVVEPGAEREFTVQINSDAFGPACLKLQDGPGICFARLEHELQGETPELRAQAHLTIGKNDIRGYLEKTYPHVPAGKKRENPSASPALKARNGW